MARIVLKTRSADTQTDLGAPATADRVARIVPKSDPPPMAEPPAPPAQEPAAVATDARPAVDAAPALPPAAVAAEPEPAGPAEFTPEPAPVAQDETPRDKFVRIANETLDRLEKLTRKCGGGATPQARFAALFDAQRFGAARAELMAVPANWTPGSASGAGWMGRSVTLSPAAAKRTSMLLDLTEPLCVTGVSGPYALVRDRRGAGPGVAQVRVSDLRPAE